MIDPVFLPDAVTIQEWSPTRGKKIAGWICAVLRPFLAMFVIDAVFRMPVRPLICFVVVGGLWIWSWVRKDMP